MMALREVNSNINIMKSFQLHINSFSSIPKNQKRKNAPDTKSKFLNLPVGYSGKTFY
ncbi:hypothetical protein C723_3009 [Christiangramia flava JLT2011]|uniref:Uncharacterized protein n=1 Tax=Christiangramia flava JLT2011 TaxID=1229726 RepID=A0A1L7I0J5_9FLAO|nr:hypothetical protein GRFL_0394 [Christiangramia flava JLT2011]OSS38110.1 hypothetical protein C723_3009 [Christiangramia flava JLT2011]